MILEPLFGLSLVLKVSLDMQPPSAAGSSVWMRFSGAAAVQAVMCIDHARTGPTQADIESTRRDRGPAGTLSVRQKDAKLRLDLSHDRCGQDVAELRTAVPQGPGAGQGLSAG